jgi:hypothetical protein
VLIKNPDYQYLIEPVSISKYYSGVSKLFSNKTPCDSNHIPIKIQNGTINKFIVPTINSRKKTK